MAASIKKLQARRRELLNRYEYAQSRKVEIGKPGQLLNEHQVTILRDLERTDTLIDQQEQLARVVAGRKRSANR